MLSLVTPSSRVWYTARLSQVQMTTRPRLSGALGNVETKAVLRLSYYTLLWLHPPCPRPPQGMGCAVEPWDQLQSRLLLLFQPLSWSSWPGSKAAGWGPELCFLAQLWPCGFRSHALEHASWMSAKHRFTAERSLALCPFAHCDTPLSIKWLLCAAVLQGLPLGSPSCGL